MKKTLLIRMDRIGDLVLTLPVDQLLKDGEVVWTISKGLEFIPENSVPKRKFLSFPTEFTFGNFFRLVTDVKKQHFDRAVIFHAPWWVSIALFFARVPVRAGKKSKLDSFIFLNRGIRQKRSESQKHEMHYNLDLLTEACNLPTFPFESLKPLKLDSNLMDIQLSKWQIEKKKYIVVHPGMGGSALNWSMASYSKFIDAIKAKTKVVVTGATMDRRYIAKLKQIQNNSKDIIWLDEKLNTSELFLVLKYAQGVLVPSTGVAHLAASLGAPVLGLYSPRRVETALRWGPCGEKVKTLTPNISGETEDSPFDQLVMERLSPNFVLGEFCKHAEIQ